MAESIREIQPAFEGFRPLPEGLNPSLREWGLHSSLFIVTIITTTIAGIMLATPELPVADPRLSGPLDYLLYVPIAYLRSAQALFLYAATHPGLLIEGLTFSAALLTILTAHEMGHYLACRYYGVSATLPFFIPAPPLFLAGTFGAFIKMISPIALVGILTLQSAPSPVGTGAIIFNDPLLLRIIAKVTGRNLVDAVPNPYYMAAWIGLLVTSLNLMPVGQLDGGHGTFALFGPRAHKLIGRIAFVAVAVLALLGWFWHGSPSGFLYTVLLAIMLKVRHPQPQQMESLGSARIWIA